MKKAYEVIANTTNGKKIKKVIYSSYLGGALQQAHVIIGNELYADKIRYEITSITLKA